MELHRDWWTGLWNCKNCGDLRMSGDFKHKWLKALARVLHWVPSCSQCGHEHVTVTSTDYDSFVCWSCSRKMEVRNGKIVTTWQPYQSKAVHQQPEEIRKENDYVVFSTQN
jgi:transcription elongation factor Elf1